LQELRAIQSIKELRRKHAKMLNNNVNKFVLSVEYRQQVIVINIMVTRQAPEAIFQQVSTETHK
jgi:hypothetical protein